ncbi:MAG: CGNR zinc finger domain-containing protein [Thermoleophilaceae bacterium]|nr:CGNR zinc finger domain-containing protein [Thermoleophilaceae bacterium]
MAANAHRNGIPREAQLVVDFVNTLDLDDGIERIGTPEELSAWLREHDLLADAEADAEDVRLAQRARELLRAVLHANNGGALDEQAVAELNSIAVSAPLVLRFRADGSAELAPECDGTRAALARLLAGVHKLVADGRWHRLKACPAEDCEWAFYDQSKNRSRTWCSMEVCGNRHKARAYRSRRR